MNLDADPEIARLVAALAEAMRPRGWRVATAESCTGGLVAAACTDLAGSSDWFEGGIVSYSNAAKRQLLGVDAALLEAHGAVSEPVARAMAAGALERLAADFAVALTGVAGPGGGSAAKPVGLVWLAWARRSRDGAVQVAAERCQFDTEGHGDRAAVRAASVRRALRGLLQQARDAAAGDD